MSRPRSGKRSRTPVSFQTPTRPRPRHSGQSLTPPAAFCAGDSLRGPKVPATGSGSAPAIAAAPRLATERTKRRLEMRDSGTAPVDDVVSETRPGIQGKAFRAIGSSRATSRLAYPSFAVSGMTEGAEAAGPGPLSCGVLPPRVVLGSSRKILNCRPFVDRIASAPFHRLIAQGTA